MNKLKEVLFENKGFKINPMQEEAASLNGANVIINAPTGSGKTEAILLNMKHGGHYLYFLPTIASSIFMFNRLKNLNLLNVKVLTSVKTESFKLDDKSGTITICCPDNPLIGYFNEGEKFEQYDGLILDEIDSYPEMVKSCIVEILKESTNHHFIVASATIDKDLSGIFEKFITNKINFNPFKEDFTKFIMSGVGFGDLDPDEEIIDILVNNKDKKIGFIMNDIGYIEELESLIKSHNKNDNDNLDFILLHGNQDEYDKNESIEKLETIESGVVLSNDALTFSIDINFDILFVQSPDSNHLMIQRLGRCNRTNVALKDNATPNIYLLECDELINDKNETSRHINEYDSQKIYDSYKDKSIFSFYDIEEIRNDLTSSPIPTFEDVKEHWETQVRNGITKSLRDTCVKMVLPISKTIKTKDGKEETISTVRILKSYGYGIPYAWKPYNSDFEKVYIYFKGETYEIVSRDDKRGDCLIKKPKYCNIDDYYESDFDDNGRLFKESYETMKNWRLSDNFKTFSSLYMDKVLYISSTDYKYAVKRLYSDLYRLIKGTSEYDIVEYRKNKSGKIEKHSILFFTRFDDILNEIKETGYTDVYRHMELTEYTCDENGVYTLETPMLFKRSSNDEILYKFIVKQVYDKVEGFKCTTHARSATKEQTLEFVKNNIINENLLFIGTLDRVDNNYNSIENLLTELLDVRLRSPYSLFTNFNYENNYTLRYEIEEKTLATGWYDEENFVNDYFSINIIGDSAVKLNIYNGARRDRDEIVITVKDGNMKTLLDLITRRGLSIYDEEEELSIEEIRNKSIEKFEYGLFHDHKFYYRKARIRELHRAFKVIKKCCDNYGEDLVNEEELSHLYFKYKKELFERVEQNLKKEE